MNRVARFEKVSEKRFVDDFTDSFSEFSADEAKEIYDSIKLPARATAKSAGYDIYMPIDYTLKPGETVKIPTGIRVYMEPDYVFMIYPRSGLGFKYRLQLNNTVGVIDADYYESDNEGHIFIKITNDSNENKSVTMEKGTGFAQGIFMQYAVTFDDDVDTKRNGGLGSTTKK